VGTRASYSRERVSDFLGAQLIIWRTSRLPLENLICHLSSLAHRLEVNRSDCQSDAPECERAEKTKCTFLAQAEQETFPNDCSDDAEYYEQYGRSYINSLNVPSSTGLF
jgi:hypothetical protein